MPRASVVESPGCPPLRVLTTDVLGLIKVVEVREKLGVPKVVETWGSPNTSQSVLVASIDDRKYNPLLAVARRNGLVELFNPLNGDAVASVRVIETSSTQPAASGDDSITGLHLFKREKLDQQSRSCTLLACTENRKASLRTIDLSNLSAGSQSTDSPNMWDISGAGKVLCCAVDGDEKFALFGGKGIEVNLWDLENCTKTWAAKSPPRNSLDLFTPTWFTAATFLCKNDHRKFAAGTNNHQVRIYDTSAQRRPVISFEFRETAIKAVAAELDGNTVYVGNGTGDLASFDIRTGRLLGSFVGKCSGSIRSIAKHPELPVLASCAPLRAVEVYKPIHKSKGIHRPKFSGDPEN
ncbi:hypothetical protein QJS10_CPB04g01769 [Acorus calamus]|uniref:WD repeat-containing protein 74 n=1 Tax=Acorus calamus TaxID=4465 RepID=A0AAV9F1E9_ACOCL|nr:hypothetical protein QJS10_CPB04g01769 [Acorus calamus]